VVASCRHGTLALAQQDICGEGQTGDVHGVPVEVPALVLDVRCCALGVIGRGASRGDGRVPLQPEQPCIAKFLDARCLGDVAIFPPPRPAQ